MTVKPAHHRARLAAANDAKVLAARAELERRGPFTQAELARSSGVCLSTVRAAIVRLAARGEWPARGAHANTYGRFRTSRPRLPMWDSVQPTEPGAAAPTWRLHPDEFNPAPSPRSAESAGDAARRELAMWRLRGRP